MILAFILGAFFLLLIIQLISTRKEKKQNKKADTLQSQQKAPATNEIPETRKYNVSESSICSYAGVQIGVCQDVGVILIDKMEYQWEQILLCKLSSKEVSEDDISGLGKKILLGGVLGMLTGNFSTAGTFASSSGNCGKFLRTIYYLHLVTKGNDTSEDISICFGEEKVEAENACSMILHLLAEKRKEASGTSSPLQVKDEYDKDSLYDKYEKYRLYILKNKENLNMERNWMPMIQQLTSLSLAHEWVIGREPESEDFHAFPAKYDKRKVFDTPLFCPLQDIVRLDYNAKDIWEAYLLYRSKMLEQDPEDCEFLFPGHGCSSDEDTPLISMKGDGSFCISHLIREESGKVLKLVTEGRFNSLLRTVSFQDLTFLNAYTLEEKIKMCCLGGKGVFAAESDVDVELWLPEMNGVNVTLFCDYLINEPVNVNGSFVIWLKKEEMRKVAFKSLEMQSSGFKIVRKIDIGLYVGVVVQASKDMVKKELSIPYMYEDGFGWGKQIQDDESTSVNKIAVSDYHHNYILNFSVDENANLKIFFFPADNRMPWLIYENDCPS